MTYVIGPYGGCDQCGTPAGFSIDLMTASDLRNWDAQRLPVLGGIAEEHFGLPLLNASLLQTKLVAALEREWPGSDTVDRDELIESMDLGTLIRETVAETVDEFNQELKKAALKGVGGVPPAIASSGGSKDAPTSEEPLVGGTGSKGGVP